MSHRFNRPKAHLNEGNARARLRRSAEMIQDQATLDRVMAAAPPAVGAAWLDQVRDYLRFTPRQPEPNDNNG